MKKIITALAAAAICAIAPVAPTAALAQYYPSGTATCEAASPFAFGVGNSYDASIACRRALYECALRTPAGYVCSVTRWWWN